jgi:hypothetical protein
METGLELRQKATGSRGRSPIMSQKPDFFVLFSLDYY